MRESLMILKLKAQPSDATAILIASLGEEAARPGWRHLGWHHIMMWNHNSTDLWWRPCFFISFGLQSHLHRKPTNFTAKPCFFVFFLVVTYFWTEKGWHHEIPPRMPPSLATPLVFIFLNLQFFRWLFRDLTERFLKQLLKRTSFQTNSHSLTATWNLAEGLLSRELVNWEM